MNQANGLNGSPAFPRLCGVDTGVDGGACTPCAATSESSHALLFKAAGGDANAAIGTDLIPVSSAGVPPRAAAADMRTFDGLAGTLKGFIDAAVLLRAPVGVANGDENGEAVFASSSARNLGPL